VIDHTRELSCSTGDWERLPDHHRSTQQIVGNFGAIEVPCGSVDKNARCPLELERRIIEFILAAAAVMVGLGIYLGSSASSTDAKHSNSIACPSQKSTPAKEAGNQKECSKAPIHS